VRRGKILNYFLTVATLVARNANEAMAAPVVGTDGVWNHTVRFMLVRLSRIWVRSP
jgi:hypothetical protein